ncbi:hypothetical protein LAUMK41_05820 [Mycobacterium attenuatum]|nr:hypothetical protein LAUMK41_05820 [Mycobacterium attenuatum]
MAAVMVAVASCSLVILAAPIASAHVDLTVGMAIQIGNHRCSLGFFGRNRRGDRLAVTAGHCSDSVDQHVMAANNVRIGEVVSRQADAEDANGRLTGSRGYTLFAVYQRFSLEPYFTSTDRLVSTNDPVTKYGERTGKTSGHVTSVDRNPDRPDLAILEADMVQIAGDSGCPWYTSGPTLIGVASSGNQAREGGSAGSQAQPIGAIIDTIRTDPTPWRDSFEVWLQPDPARG